MRVLLTNNTLDQLAGSEMYVHDVALELVRRGHKPVAYSTKLGRVAEILRSATVPVIDTLDSLGEPPDIIHGHHHYETQTALLRFPDTPAIYFCHGWSPWQEAPLLAPQIQRYVAVDELCRERLITEGGIPSDRIELLFNFFDERRFPARGPLPAQPRTALAFGNTFGEAGDLPSVRESCSRCGIDLHVVGLGHKVELNPGSVLAGYDLVFAKGRAAIEALAVGAAVVLCGYGRLGPMVTTENFESLRRLNFGMRTLDQPLSADLVIALVNQYDAGDASDVSRLARAACGMQPAVDRLIDLYGRVVAGANQRPAVDRLQASIGAARYLERWAVQYKEAFEVSRERQYWRERCLVSEQGLSQRDDQLREMNLIADDRDRWVQRCNNTEQALAQRDHRLHELDSIEKKRQLWIERCHATEEALLEWVNRSSASEAALAERNLLLEQATSESSRLSVLLSERDAEAAALARELASIRSSATWQWTQRLLRSGPVQTLFGPLIRSVAARSRHPEPSLSPSGTLPSPHPLLHRGPSNDAVFTLQQRADKMMSERGFLGVPRETFTQAGREQFTALLREGLRPESNVLEFGCGCLRIAYWLVRFLDSGRYYGIEPARQRVEDGLSYLFTPEEILLKRPSFDFNPVFDASVFAQKFDFFLARSIWTHASKPQIEATLDTFIRDAAPHATFLASYLPAGSPEEDYQGSLWVGTSHESDVPGVIRHSLAWITEQCRRRSLRCEEIPGFDCDSQLWLRVTCTEEYL